MLPIKILSCRSHTWIVTCLVYNKTVPDDDFIESKHVVIETQVFLLVVLMDKIKSKYSVWLRAGRPGDRDSISGGGKGFFL
jgi:hypothetical protein